MENQFSLQTRRGTKLQDRSKLEKPNSSYADLKSKTIKNIDNVPPPSSRNHQKLRIERKSVESEEIVKCMSTLPSFLERGANLQENTFNVGVLDWSQLEKWQSNYKQIPYSSSGYSQSSSNTSSFFSTDGSSTHSSIGRSFSPARQRMHRPTLLAHLKASPNEANSQRIKGDDGKFQDLKLASSKSLKGQQSMLRAYQSFNKHHSEFKLKERERKDTGPQIVPELQNSPKLGNHGGPSLLKGKVKIQDVESTKGGGKLQEPYYHVVDHNRSERIRSKDNHSAISYPSDLISVNGRRSTEASRRSFPEGSFSEGTYHSKFYSDIPYSCPLPCDIESIENSQTKQPNSKDSKSFKSSSEPLHCSAKRSISPPKSKNIKEKKSTKMPTNSIVIKLAKGPDLNKDTVVAAKVRNSSPPRRFSFGMGRIGRSSSSKDSSEGAMAPALLDKSTRDKSNAAIRARSSPLRRLLDPLLKPKAANSHHCVDPSQKESLNAHSVKGKLDLGSCRKINFDDSHHNEKSGSSKVQAFLQVAMKNGIPLFTFAVEGEILAATMRNLSTSGKENSWIYTFFTVRDVKKKNGWMNQGTKRKGHGFVPNVVAQMKVSDSQFSKLIRQNTTDQFSIKEFVLFAVDLRQADQQIPDLQPNDELAAIVVKLPKETSQGLNQDAQKSNNFNYQSPIGLKDPLPERRGYSNSRDNEKNGSFVGAHDSFSTTVLLPGGFHGLPSKGEPSPLIERWKSGGLCDCGGWDMGCRIRVLANQTQLGMRVTSSKPHPNTGQFELFSQGEVLDDRPVFSVSPFNDGIFSVEFGSSLTHLQAFSICIAILNCGKPYELSELSNLFEEEFSEVTKLMENDETKACNPVEVEVPSRFASYPPHSPVARA